MRPWFAVVAFIVLAAAPALATEFSCDETGVLAAIGAGGGPHTFDCAGPTTVVTTAELVVSQAVEIDGEGLLTLSGGNTHRVMRVEGAAPFTATLRDLGFIAGVATGSFGGCISALEDLTLVGVEVFGCQAAFGGGVAVTGASLTLDGCEIAGNLATGGEVNGLGGGVAGIAGGEIAVTNSAIRENTANLGGGIGALGELTVIGSTIADNVADAGAGVVAVQSGALAISRSTISGNRATNVSGNGGGAIAIQGLLSWTIEDSTLAGNLNAAILNAGISGIPSTLHISGSTIAGNTGSLPAIHQLTGVTAFRNTVIAGRCDGTVQDLGGNFQSPGVTCAGVATTALKLGKLGDHGGPTQTIPLLPGSVAIDAAVGCPPPATDQRGVARPQGAACDSGAYEQDFGPQVPALPPVAGVVLAAVLLALARGRRNRR